MLQHNPWQVGAVPNRLTVNFRDGDGSPPAAGMPGGSFNRQLGILARLIRITGLFDSFLHSISRRP